MRRIITIVLLLGLFAAVSLAADFDSAKEVKSKPVVTTQKSETAKQVVNKSLETTTPSVPQTVPATTPNAGEQIKWQVIAAGGTIGAGSTNYRLSGTVAQTSVGYGESDNFGLGGGFWRIFEPGGCCVGRVGDANGLGVYPDEISLGDIMLMVDVLFISNVCTKLACPDEADVNQSGGPNPAPEACLDYLSLADIMTLVDFLFITGPQTAVLPDCL